MKTYIKLTIVSTLLVFFYACSDDDKNVFNDFQTDGGFVRFSENPPSNIGVNSISELNYSFELLDPNESTASYDLKIYADLAGQRTDTLPVATITSFPTSISYSASDLAGFLGVTVADIGFGDNFFFTAEVTSKNGVKYNGLEDIAFDDLGDDDPNTFELSGGGLSPDLIDEVGYRQAFEFDFIILCPDAFTVDQFIGTWEITADPFGAVVADDNIFEIVAGPGANQVTMLDPYNNLDPATGGTYNVVLDFDPNSGAVTVQRQPAWHCDNLGCGFGEGRVEGDGFVFICVDIMKLNLQHTVNAGSFGTFPIDFRKL